MYKVQSDIFLVQKNLEKNILCRILPGYTRNDPLNPSMHFEVVGGHCLKN